LANADQTKGQVSRKQLKEEKKLLNPNRRVIPIWLRLVIVLSLSALALVLGLMIGYGMLGDGAPLDALKKETWQHIIDIVNKKEEPAKTLNRNFMISYNSNLIHRKGHRPVNKQTIKIISSMTSKICTRPPAILKAKPRPHNINKIMKMVHSIVNPPSDR